MAKILQGVVAVWVVAGCGVAVLAMVAQTAGASGRVAALLATAALVGGAAGGGVAVLVAVALVATAAHTASVAGAEW